MELQNKKELLRKLKTISDAKIQQGLLLLQLIKSLEHHYKDKPFKEWKEFIKPVIDNMMVKDDKL